MATFCWHPLVTPTYMEKLAYPFVGSLLKGLFSTLGQAINDPYKHDADESRHDKDRATV